MRLFSIAVLAFLTACGAEQQTAAPADAPAPRAAAPEEASSGPVSATNMEQWTRTCALCHVRGEGGAPVIGDRASWIERRAQGEDVLLAHTIEGINNMPPLGYCMDCSEADFRALIRFMGGDS